MLKLLVLTLNLMGSNADTLDFYINGVFQGEITGVRYEYTAASIFITTDIIFVDSFEGEPDA